MKYIKQFELTKFYDEKDIFKYIYEIDSPKIKELISKIPNINLNIKNSNGDTPLIITIRYGLYQIFKILIDSGADVNTTDNFGNTPLILVVRNKKEEMIQDLITAGADINKINNNSETALIVNSNYNYRDKKALKITKFLIENGADWNITDDIDHTFIDYLPPAYRKEIIEEYPEEYSNYLMVKNTNKFNI